jgi:sugar/nucleoside kinase (ribokinase family)
MKLLSFLSFVFLVNLNIHADYDTIGFGAPCVDMVYKIDEKILKSMPVRKGDGQRASWEIFSEVLDACAAGNCQPVITTGGTASNTIKGLASLGNSTAFVGKIGSDSKGDFYTNTVKKLGIDLFLIPSDIPTTQIGVFVTPDQQRTFLSFAGAGQSITAQEIKKEFFKDGRLVHIDGYMLEDIPGVETVMQYAKAEGSIIALDIGCLRIARTYKEEILRLLSTYTDIVFANEDEVEALVEFSGPKACTALTQYCPISVLLAGKQGCWVSTKEELLHSPAITVQAIDTTGAGDLFSAGFLHGYLKGYALKDCAWLGNLLGGTVVSVLGAEIPEEKWVGVRERINAHFGSESRNH